MNDIRHQLQQAASDDGVPLRTDVPELLARARADRRRHRTRATALAALPTAAVLALGSVYGPNLLPADSSDADTPTAATGSDGTSDSTSTQATAPTDPGLPPNAENLYHVVVTADGWTFDGMENDPLGGSQYWSDGQQRLEVQWYPAEQYDTYLADRRVGTTEREVELLGQSGHEFTEKLAGGQNKHAYIAKGKEIDWPKAAAGENVRSGLRGYTILPPVGDFFLMIDVWAEDRAAHDEVVESLTRVSEDRWNATIDAATISKAEGEAFLADAKQGVPIPDGVEVTVDDLNLPQYPYGARADFVGPVLCGWAERYLDGDEQALEVLRGSRDWPVLQAMRSEGAYPEVAAEEVEQLASGTTDKGNPYTLEHFAQAVC